MNKRLLKELKQSYLIQVVFVGYLLSSWHFTASEEVVSESADLEERAFLWSYFFQAPCLGLPVAVFL